MYILFISLILTNSLFAQTNDPTQMTEPCISQQDFKDLSKNFSQIRDLKKQEKSYYCQKDFNEQWFVVLKTLNHLKNFTAPIWKENPEDGLSQITILEKNWWDYFIHRAKKFRLPRKIISDASCSKNTIAYVNLPERGIINFCPLFFNPNVSFIDRVTTLMHEVKHFEDSGHPHVACTHGPFKGIPGTCDQALSDRGSYAAGLNVVVAFALDPNTNEKDRLALQSKAIYKANNNFNIVPEVKIDEHLVLTDLKGDVFEKKSLNSMPVLKTTLPEPATITQTKTNFYDSFTFYPLSGAKSYRVLNDYSTKIDNVLPLQAQWDTQASHLALMSNNYVMLTERALYSNCGTRNVFSLPLDDDVVSILELPDADKLSSFVIQKDGGVDKINCGPQGFALDSTTLTITRELLTIEPLQSTRIDKQSYAVTTNGQLISISIDNGQLILDDIEKNPQHHWISLARKRTPTLFENKDAQ